MKKSGLMVHVSYLLKQGVPKVVSERLRHSNIAMTMDLYSHIAPTRQREAAEGFDDILFKKGLKKANVTVMLPKSKIKTKGKGFHVSGSLVFIGAGERT